MASLKRSMSRYLHYFWSIVHLSFFPCQIPDSKKNKFQPCPHCTPPRYLDDQYLQHHVDDVHHNFRWKCPYVRIGCRSKTFTSREKARSHSVAGNPISCQYLRYRLPSEGDCPPKQKRKKRRKTKVGQV